VATITSALSVQPGWTVGQVLGTVPTQQPHGLNHMAGFMVAPASAMYWETHNGTSGGAPELQYAVHIRLEYVDALPEAAGGEVNISHENLVYLAAASLRAHTFDAAPASQNETRRRQAIAEARTLLVMPAEPYVEKLEGQDRIEDGEKENERGSR
jgi:hypothetical protein